MNGLDRQNWHETDCTLKNVTDCDGVCPWFRNLTNSVVAVVVGNRLYVHIYSNVEVLSFHATEVLSSFLHNLLNVHKTYNDCKTYY